MKSNNSSDAAGSSINITIPKIQHLLPIETPLAGNWSNTTCLPELITTATKRLSPPISITPSSIYTDSSEIEYQPVDLSATHKYSISSPPLSNTKSESLDSADCSVTSSNRQDSTMVLSHNEKCTSTKLSSLSYKITKHWTNFSIEHILSSSYRSPTYELLQYPHKQMNSIFTKIKRQHYSDNYLHRIIKRENKLQLRPKQHYLFQYSIERPNRFLRCILNLFDSLLNQYNYWNARKKFANTHALEQLAHIACETDTRYHTSEHFVEKFTKEDYEQLLKQCWVLIKNVYFQLRKCQIQKRLHIKNYSRKVYHKRFLHLLLSILNRIKRKLNILLNGKNHSDCHMLMSDIRKYMMKENDTKRKSICDYLTVDKIMPDLEILVPNNNLLYEATIQPIHEFNDLFLVRLNHDRQTYLIPTDDLCRVGCLNIIPNDLDVLSVGSRVCAYWSTSLRGLHPATVKSIPKDTQEASMVNLIFDDGDSGLIKLNEIRLLPDNYSGINTNLQEWCASSFQIPSTSNRQTTRRGRFTATNGTSSSKTFSRKRRTSSASSITIPQWTLNIRNSTISRQDNKEVIRHGDCVVLHGVDRTLSYIGKVLKFYRNKSNQQDFVRLKWYYSPKETSIGLQENDLPGALYESTHVDENAISTIRYKGTIYKSFDDYVKNTNFGKKRKETEFYIVGRYNPTTGELVRFDRK